MTEEVARSAQRVVQDYMVSLAEEYVGICARCKICSSVCPVYLSTRDPRLTPWHRLEVAIKLAKGVKPSETDMMVLFTCTGCGACSLACPLRLKTWFLIYLAKCWLAFKGYAPKSIQETANIASKSLHSFTADPSLATRWISEAGANTSSGDYLYVPASIENVFYTSEPLLKVKLFKELEVPYVVSPRAQDVGGNIAMDMGRPDIALKALMNVVEEAERIGARWVIVSECGADHKWVYALAPLLVRDLGLGIGIEKFKSIHHVLVEGFEKNKPNIAKIGESAYYSSCTFGRYFPEIYDRVRKLIALIGTRIEEKPWRCRYNACCGGGGLNVLREGWAKEIRKRIGTSRVKSFKSQTIIVPCTKCYISFRQSCIAAKVRKNVKLVSRALYEAIERSRGKEGSKN